MIKIKAKKLWKKNDEDNILYFDNLQRMREKIDSTQNISQQNRDKKNILVLLEWVYTGCIGRKSGHV